MKNTETDTRNQSRTIGLYRGLIFLLLAVVVVQSLVMFKLGEDTDAPPENEEAITAGTAATAGTNDPTSATESVQSSDLVRSFNQVSVRFNDITEYREWLFLIRQGAVRARALGFGQEEPLRFHRRSSKAVYVVAGEGVIEHTCGTTGLEELPLSAGTVVLIEPYCAYRLRNTTTESMLTQLEFLTPAPLNEHTSDAVLVSADDPRGRLGPAPVTLDLLGRLEATQAEALPLGSSGAALVREVVSGETTYGAMDGETGLFVLAGEGVLQTTSDTKLSPGTWALVSPGTPFSLHSLDSPLHVLRFSPGEDGVPNLVRSGRSIFSQMAEERIARSFFEDRRGGVFLDVGAGHYQRVSTTYYLDSRLDWSGVAVDAQAEYAADYAVHRPRTQYLTYLISDEDGVEGTLFRDERVDDAASVNERVTREQTELTVEDAEIEQISVPMITLNTLLTQAEVERIDFFSMDIEEHEPAALRGFDIERFRPALVCIESHGRTQDVLYEYFVSHGYERLDDYLAYDPVNWYFAPIDR